MTANIYKALPHYLKNNSGVAAQVSDRIYPIRLPQTVDLPAIIFQDVSFAATQAHGEASTLPRPRFQFTIYGGTVASVDAAASALKAALDGYKGNMGTGSYTTKVEACLLKNQVTNDEPDLGLYQRLQDYVIQYKE